MRGGSRQMGMHIFYFIADCEGGVLAVKTFVFSRLTFSPPLQMDTYRGARAGGGACYNCGESTPVY